MLQSLCSKTRGLTNLKFLAVWEQFSGSGEKSGETETLQPRAGSTQTGIPGKQLQSPSKGLVHTFPFEFEH